jgi:hypothetical protein
LPAAAVQGNWDEALSKLREAVDQGLRPMDDLHIETDPDLKSLHGDPRFAGTRGYVLEDLSAESKRRKIHDRYTLNTK